MICVFLSWQVFKRRYWQVKTVSWSINYLIMIFCIVHFSKIVGKVERGKVLIIGTELYCLGHVYPILSQTPLQKKAHHHGSHSPWKRENWSYFFPNRENYENMTLCSLREILPFFFPFFFFLYKFILSSKFLLIDLLATWWPFNERIHI